MSDIEERDTVTVEIPLDPAHRPMDLALRENDVPVEDMLARNLTPKAEQVLHEAIQTVKYSDDAANR